MEENEDEKDIGGDEDYTKIVKMIMRTMIIIKSISVSLIVCHKILQASRTIVCFLYLSLCLSFFFFFFQDMLS